MQSWTLAYARNTFWKCRVILFVLRYTRSGRLDCVHSLNFVGVCLQFFLSCFCHFPPMIQGQVGNGVWFFAVSQQRSLMPHLLLHQLNYTEVLRSHSVVRADTHLKTSLGGCSDLRDELSREFVLYFITSPAGCYMLLTLEREAFFTEQPGVCVYECAFAREEDPIWFVRVH